MHREGLRASKGQDVESFKYIPTLTMFSSISRIMGVPVPKENTSLDMTYHPAEYEDPKPGRGAIKPRSWNVASDAQKVLLNGDWRFRFSPTARISEEFAQPDGVDDKKWEKTPVPSHWVLHGHGAPAYQNIQFPFPVDPPFVPDENPTGDYRLSFDLPKNWSLDKGKVRRSHGLC